MLYCGWVRYIHSCRTDTNTNFYVFLLFILFFFLCTSQSHLTYHIVIGRRRRRSYVIWMWRRSWRLHIVQKCGGPSVIEQCIIFIPSWFIRFNAHRLFNGANKASINRKKIVAHGMVLWLVILTWFIRGIWYQKYSKCPLGINW